MKICVLGGEKQHYKDTKLKTESQVFQDIFCTKCNRKGGFVKRKNEWGKSRRRAHFGAVSIQSVSQSVTLNFGGDVQENF